jgi:hypothetical protein
MYWDMPDGTSAIVNTLSSTIDIQDNQGQDVKPYITGLDPIHVAATSKILELFLSMLSPVTRELVFASLTFEQCRDLLTFTERYECRALVPSIRAQLIQKTGPGQSTALFLFASNRDDWSLAREAMKRMDTTENGSPFGISAHLLRQCGEQCRSQSARFLEPTSTRMEGSPHTHSLLWHPQNSQHPILPHELEDLCRSIRQAGQVTEAKSIVSDFSTPLDIKLTSQ